MSAYRKFVDSLESESWTSTPPKPSKPPKTDPSEPVSLPVLGGLDALAAVPLKIENTVHTTTHPQMPFSAGATWGDVKGEPAVDAEYGSAGTAIVAPGKWVERIALPRSNEPAFSEPWPPRRGWIEWHGKILLHFCSVCGAWGSYGFGVNLRGGRMGRWFCAAHRPRERKTR